jgi:hypothetical protein
VGATLTLVDLQVRGGHDEHNALLLGLPPVGIVVVHDRERVALSERELIRVLAVVRVQSNRVDYFDTSK